MTMAKFDSNTPILLAESDPEIQKAFQPILDEFQIHNLTIEEDGYEVLRNDHATNFELIILGSSLAGMGASKVVAALRSDDNNKKTPILFMHSAADKESAERVMKAGATAALQWPVNKKTFHKTLEKLLNKRIVTKSEEKEIVNIFVDRFKSSVDKVKSLRWDGKTEEAEAAFVETLREFFLTSAGMHDAREDSGKTERIIREGKSIFPRLEIDFQNRTAGAPEEASGGGAGARVDAPADKIDPLISILVADSNNNSLAIYRNFFGELQLGNVSFLSDGLSALREDDAKVFDLVFLNYHLSDMPGMKVLAAARAAFDHLAARPEVDEKRIGVYGRSFGSFWAFRAAAAEPRFAACAGAVACFYWDRLTIFEESPIRFKQVFMEMSGIEDEEEFDRVAEGYTLQGHAEQIRCPALMVTGEFDPLNPIEQTEAVFGALSGPKELWVFEDEFHPLRSVEAVGGRPVYSHIASWLSRAMSGGIPEGHSRKTLIKKSGEGLYDSY